MILVLVDHSSKRTSKFFHIGFQIIGTQKIVIASDCNHGFHFCLKNIAKMIYDFNFPPSQFWNVTIMTFQAQKNHCALEILRCIHAFLHKQDPISSMHNLSSKAGVIYNVKNGSSVITSKNSSKNLSNSRELAF